jgi:methionine-gamma-lyase
MELMQSRNLGYLAVSLGSINIIQRRNLYWNSSRRTSWNGIDWWINSFSIGLDNDIKRTYEMMKACMKELDIL